MEYLQSNSMPLNKATCNVQLTIAHQSIYIICNPLHFVLQQTTLSIKFRQHPGYSNATLQVLPICGAIITKYIPYPRPHVHCFNCKRCLQQEKINSIHSPKLCFFKPVQQSLAVFGVWAFISMARINKKSWPMK